MASLELKHIKGNTYYIPSPANIGVYAEDGEAVLIDTGNDREAGRQIVKLAEAEGLKIKLIVNTHSNADHCGGNAFISQKTGCRIAASKIEAAFIENPVLEPAFLFGGFPHNSIKNKFLMAQPSKVTDIVEPGKQLDSYSFEFVDLPGHFFGMIGVKTPDNVFFAADTLFSEEIISKYSIFYLLDVEKHLETLDMLEKLKADYYLPSHALLAKDIGNLININRNQILSICDDIAQLTSGSGSGSESGSEIDSILSGICSLYSIELNDNQYVLVQSTLKAYLVYLLQKGVLTKTYRDGRLYWKKQNN